MSVGVGDGQKELHNQNVLLPGVISQDLAALVAAETCNFGKQSLRVLMHKMNFEWADSRFDELLLTGQSESHEVYCFRLPGEEVEVDEAFDDGFDMLAATRDRGKRQRTAGLGDTPAPQPPKASGRFGNGPLGTLLDHLAHVVEEEEDWCVDPDVLADTVADDDHHDHLGSDCDDRASSSESDCVEHGGDNTTEAARCGLYMGNPY